MTVTTVWEWMGVCGLMFFALLCYATIEQSNIDNHQKDDNNDD